MINKEQIMVVPVSYTSHIDNGFTGAISMSTDNSYSLYDSTGIYEPRYKIDNNICFIKIAIILIFKKDNKFLVKELINTEKKPCIEMGINSYIKPSSGNYNALYNQIKYILEKDLKLNSSSVNIKFLGHIKDSLNSSVKSTLGNIYYIDIDNNTEINSNSTIYNYKWYSLMELVDRYNKGTSWTRHIIDCLLDKKIYIN